MRDKLFTLLAIFLFSITTTQAQNLISAENIGGRTITELVGEYGLPFLRNGVDYYKITYTTPDVQGVLDTASGLVVVPVTLNKAFPILVYQHGTLDSPIDVPSLLAGGYQLAEIWSAMGYMVAAPDLLGMGEARGFHPFVHAATEASAAIDMITAMKQFADENDKYYNDQLFVTGYSQGGHSAAALHQVLEADFSTELPLTASAPMSGPYSISGVMKDVMLSTDAFGFVGYLPNTVISMQTAYGNIYDDLEDIFKPEYAALIEPYANGEKTLFELNIELIDKLIVDFGSSVPRFTMQEDFINEFQSDPMHPLNIALRDNDLVDWTPQAPTRLLYCTADDQVSYLNSVVADSVMNANGAVDVQAIDVNSAADHGGCVTPAMLNAISFFDIYSTIDDVVSTKDPQIAKDVLIYPNPASDVIQIENNLNDVEITVSNINGQEIFFTKIPRGKQSVDISALKSGIYFVKIMNEDHFYTKKITVK